MNLLLPHSFKKAGLLMAPLGFVAWLSMQLRLTNRLYTALGIINAKHEGEQSTFAALNTAVAIVAFFSFLAGLYFIAFSKERVEDEMIAKLRLSSFQFAAAGQAAFFVLSFGWMAISKTEPAGDGGLALFFMAAVVLFWALFILRFNFVIHLKPVLFKGKAGGTV